MPGRPCLKSTWLQSQSLGRRILRRGRLRKRKTAKNWNWKRRKHRLKPCWTRKLAEMAQSMPARKFELPPRPQAIHSGRSALALATSVRATKDEGEEIADAAVVGAAASVVASRPP